MSGTGETLAFDLSGLVVSVSGLDDALAESFRREWSAFSAPPVPRAWLDVEVGDSGKTIVTRPAMRGIEDRAVDGDGARFASEEGSIALEPSGPARALIGSGDPAWRFWGLANLITAALAYRLPSRPGALLHAAGIVVDEKAFLLLGASGSGKSTWARAARAGGARVVGDDAVVVDAADGTVALLGTPVRAHQAHPGGAGRWPVAAILHSRFGPTPALGDVAPLVVHARLVANLPFVGDALGRDARVAAVADLLAARVPHRELTFAPDPSFLGCLRSGA